jgi:glutamate/tyrosine decarboxylase-like PLP-dependent enzyme
LRLVPNDEQFRIDLAALRRMMAEDSAAGFQPFCVVGNAGTVSTGATDDLEALAAICHQAGLWFHVDGAFGALAHWSENLRHIVKGIEEADSVALDLHKWMYQPFTAACLLVRDRDAHRRTFATSTAYLASTDRGVAAGGLPFFDLGIDLTREFRALKVWMSLKAHGARMIAELIEQNVEQARKLARMVEENSELQLLAPVPLNIVCFRYAPQGQHDDEFLNQINQELLLRLQETGAAVPSSTLLQNRFAIRCAFVNHRTRSADVDSLAEAVIRIGRAVYGELKRAKR